MKTTIYNGILLLLVLIFLPQNAISAEEPKISEGEVLIEGSCTAFYKKLLTCEEYKCETESPNTGEPVGNYIQGYDSSKPKLCITYQSTPNNDIITCKYTDEGRKFVANMMQKQAQGYSPTDDELTLMDHVFKTECSINEFDFNSSGRIN